MSREYVNNHYVPQWYQKRFIPHGQIDNELFYCNLKPMPFIDPQGVSRPSRTIKKQGTRLCFKEDDLYARWFILILNKYFLEISIIMAGRLSTSLLNMITKILTGMTKCLGI